MSQYCSNPTLLYNILKGTNSFLVGSCTLPFLFPHNDLTSPLHIIPLQIACRTKHIPRFLTFFNRMGYPCDFFINLDATSYPSRFTLCSASGDFRVMLIHDDDSPLFRVAYLQYTAFMNALSPDIFVFLYPKLTFNQTSITTYDAPGSQFHLIITLDSCALSELNILSDFGFRIKTNNHVQDESCPASGCKSYRRADDKETARINLVINQNTQGYIDSVISWHLGGSNCIVQDSPFYSHFVSVLS